MCGIAGAFDLEGEREFSFSRLNAMGQAIAHRGPDDCGSHIAPGVALHNRRLAIVDLEGGRQPVANEDGTVLVVFNGEIFNHPELRTQLEQRGHRFQTHSDTEVLVHLWEEHGRSMVDHLEGQFAFALFDSNKKSLFLARDPFGVCPLFLHRTADGWLLFCSEIKGLLASGLLRADLDRRGVDHIFSFFAMGTRRTMFSGVESMLPGHALLLHADGTESEFCYFDLEFPRSGEELTGDVEALATELGRLLERSVSLRLRADVPVVSYLSGGVDSSLVARLAGLQEAERGRQLETFTIRITDPKLDETERALTTARLIGSNPVVVPVSNQQISDTYPALVSCAETPVIDTSSAALHLLSARVHERGYKVTLSGEGADEALAGYPWHKSGKVVSFFDGLGLGNWWRSKVLPSAGRGRLPWEFYRQRYERLGGFHAMSDLYVFCGLSGIGLYSEDFMQEIMRAGLDATADFEGPLEAMAGWHPLNRSLYLGYKIMLCGLLMTHKGDRPALAHSVEARFPFLDREVTKFCSRLSPSLKLKGLHQDKYLLRRYAQKHLDPVVALRPKHIFRAAYGDSFLNPSPAYVDQLLSTESLQKTGLFSARAVKKCREYLSRPHRKWGPHMGWEVGLVGVVSTQLWYHLFVDPTLCELPAWKAPEH